MPALIKNMNKKQKKRERSGLKDVSDSALRSNFSPPGKFADLQ